MTPLLIRSRCRDFATDWADVPLKLSQASITMIDRIGFGPHHASGRTISRRCPAKKMQTNGAATHYKENGRWPNKGTNSSVRLSPTLATIFLTTKKLAKRKRHMQLGNRIALAVCDHGRKATLPSLISIMIPANKEDEILVSLLPDALVPQFRECFYLEAVVRRYLGGLSTFLTAYSPV